MVKICIIGSGNVAQHLITAFLKSDETQLVQVFARNPENVSHLISADKITSDLNMLKDADLYIISVSDAVIERVSMQLPFANRLTVHTSGSLSVESLDAKNRRGVFYPLQTFSKNRQLDFEAIPICIETENPADFTILEKVANSISKTVVTIDGPQRKSLHVAAVFVNNFTNHLYAFGEKICQENGIQFDILKPLIRETANKVMALSPKEAQTGPAIRHDDITVEAHLAFLKDTNQKNIYKILTQSIQHDAEL